MAEYFLHGDAGKVYFKLPETWKVIKNVTLKSEKGKASISELVGRAIENPIGTPSLREVVKGKRNVVIVVDDVARPTPKEPMLTPLVGRLNEYGIKDSDIIVLIGLGTHRPLTDVEMTEVFGEALVRRIRIVNHDCRADDLVSIGTLKYGGELKINPLAAAADVRIAVGSVLPHPLAGFGGGPKAVLPGIVNFEAIRKHHLALMIEKGVMIGNRENNPFRDEICEAARLAKLDFIVNAVYDADEDVKAVVAGDFQKAHASGMDQCSKELGVRFDQAADVTISSAFPYTEGPQVMKPMCPAVSVTKNGGVLIFYVSAVKGGRLPAPLLQAFDTAFSLAQGDSKTLVLDYRRDGKCIVPTAPMDFNTALNMTLLYENRVRTILVSEAIDEQEAKRLGFDYSRSLQAAIDAVAWQRPAATVNILPAGGLVLPLLHEDMRFGWE